MRLFSRKKAVMEPRPEVEQTSRTMEIVVANSLEEARCFARDRRLSPHWVFARDIMQVAGIRMADFYFVGNWSKLPDGPELWNFAITSGSEIFEF